MIYESEVQQNSVYIPRDILYISKVSLCCRDDTGPSVNILLRN